MGSAANQLVLAEWGKFGAGMLNLYKGFLKEHSLLLSWLVRLMDLAVLVGSGWLAFVIVLERPSVNFHYLTAFVLAGVLSLSIYPFFSVYRSWRGATLMQELRTILFAWAALFIALALLSVATKTSAAYSRLWFAHWFFIGVGLLVTTRIMIRGILASIRKEGMNHRQIVIVGASKLGRAVAERVMASPWHGYDIVGFFSSLEGARSGSLGEGIPYLGTTDQVADYVANHHIDQVWIAMSMDKTETIKQVMASLDTTTVDVCYVPDIFSFSLLNHSVTEVGDMPVVNISVSPMIGGNRLLKALEDRLLAAAILFMISPIMLLLAIGVKLSSPGPVFYRQERVSWNGMRFQMLKFRSMPVDTESAGVKWGNSKDKALIPFGQFIRKTSLDELPQFINVLLGDMSIVGPRPERTIFVQQFKDQIPGYMKKHKVKAGITGWAQVNGWRGDTDLARRVECDLYYIRNWSPWFDMKIIFLTIFKGFINKNAY